MVISNPSGKSEYTGQARPLFKIGLRNAVLTLLTLGIYRFWARSRERRYMWSAMRPAGMAMEYTGNGLEKFLGFLIAVAFLAVYLGIFQILLSFAGYAFFETDPETGIAVPGLLFSIAPILLLPFIFYAQYRGRRYVLSRTRWRGIRFGADKAAWAYVGQALKHTLITIVTLGILFPRQVFLLEKFRTDRSYFGTAKFHQFGDWKILLPVAKHVYIGLGLTLAGRALLGISAVRAGMADDFSGGFPVGFGLGGIAITVGYTWLFVGLLIFPVASWRIMAAEKVLGEKIRFKSEVDTATVVVQQLLGSFAAMTIAMIVAAILGFIFGLLFSGFGEDAALIAGMALGYLSFFILFLVLRLIMVTQPVLREFVSSLTILNPEALDNIEQREGDDFVEAEGFADALDVGAAI